MKKVVCFVSLLITILIVGCSSDNDFVIPEIPGQNMDTDEVQLVFKATTTKSVLTFSVESGDDKRVKINWGDNQKLTSYESSGEISYTYPEEDKEYIITIRASKITSLDLTNQSANNLLGVYLGNCPELTKLNFNKENRLSAFDLSKCPQFKNITISVNTSSFDWKGLSNVINLDIMVNASTDIDLTGFRQLAMCGIFVDVAKTSHLGRFKLYDNPELKSLTLSGYSYLGGVMYPIGINTWDVTAPAIHYMLLRNVIVHGDVNLAKMDGLRELTLYGFECRGEITFNPGLEEFTMQNEWNPNVNWRLGKLDFSGHKNLTYLSVIVQPGITSVDVSGAERLQRIMMQKCNIVTELSLENLPSLTSVGCFNNDYLENLKLKNLPGLLVVTAHDNPMLSSIALGNSPKTWDMNLSRNNLGDAAIKSIFSALPGVYPEVGKRKYSIVGNPGDLPAVHEFIQNLGQWRNADNPVEGNANKHAAPQDVIPNIDHGIIRLRAE